MPIHSRHHTFRNQRPTHCWSDEEEASLLCDCRDFASDKLNSREFRAVDEGVLQAKGLYYGQYGEVKNISALPFGQAPGRPPGKT